MRSVMWRVSPLQSVEEMVFFFCAISENRIVNEFSTQNFKYLYSIVFNMDFIITEHLLTLTDEPMTMTELRRYVHIHIVLSSGQTRAEAPRTRDRTRASRSGPRLLEEQVRVHFKIKLLTEVNL